MKFRKLSVVLVVVLFGIATVTALHFTVGFDSVIGAETTEDDGHDHGDNHGHESENSHAGEEIDADNAHEHGHDDDHGDEHDHDAEANADNDHDHDAEAAADDEHDHAHDDENVIHIEKEEMAEYGIKTSVAEPGQLRISLDATGEVIINPDRLSHIVPYISGVVFEVRKRLGDSVRKGETMAVIESRELSDLQSSFLVARERLNMAETMYRREKRLWECEPELLMHLPLNETSKAAWPSERMQSTVSSLYPVPNVSNNIMANAKIAENVRPEFDFIPCNESTFSSITSEFYFHIN